MPPRFGLALAAGGVAVEAPGAPSELDATEAVAAEGVAAEAAGAVCVAAAAVAAATKRGTRRAALAAWIISAVEEAWS